MATYQDHMLAGYEAMMQAANQETQSHRNIWALADAMHGYWDIAVDHFRDAAVLCPTADVQWATAANMCLLAEEMKQSYKRPQ